MALALYLIAIVAVGVLLTLAFRLLTPPEYDDETMRDADAMRIGIADWNDHLRRTR